MGQGVLKHGMRTLKTIMIVALFLLYSSASAWAGDIDYTVAIAGVEDSVLKSSLEEKSLLIRLADKKPETIAALNRRIENDLNALKTVMQENGYYGASLASDIADESGKKKITIRIEKGPIYTVGSFNLHWKKEKPPEIDALAALEFPVGDPALPGAILDAEQNVLTVLMQNGFPFPRTETRKLSVNHGNRKIAVDLFIDPGSAARFGPAQITGLETLEEPFVKRRVSIWQEEDFNIQKIAGTRKSLTRSGVISSVDVEYGDITENGQMPIVLDITESKHRSIGAGAAYSTTRGPVSNVFWEHRNLFGQAEKLRVKGEIGTETYALAADMNKPDMFGNTNISWKNAIEFRQESLEAYDKDTASASTALNYKYSSTSAVSGGVAAERSRIKEEGEDDETFTMIAFPVTYRYDGTDNFLNPREGIRFNLGVTPYQVLNEQNTFIKTDAGASHYWPVGEKFVWANRVRAAVIQGQSLDDIPADKRLYAGGGGSVRGYGYQLLGPLDENNNPTGGRMAFELATEGRVKVTESIEAVAFLEGGRVSEDLNFSTSTDFLWGAGTGMRYHTSVGPLRADIAVPLDKRNPDNAFQFYISLGQAF